MREAVVVATARSPIGRAIKGSLRSVRPDDLAATVIRAALDKVPQLDSAEIDDLHLGCAEPHDEHGRNIARRTAVLLGLDHVPGTTVVRACASSVQTARMALHAIKATEGDVFISAGVECVSRYRAGMYDPATDNPLFDDAKRRTQSYAESNARWQDPRDHGWLPDGYIAMGQTAENVATLLSITRKEQDEFGVRSQNLAEQAIKSGFYEREITPITRRTARPWPRTTAPAPARPAMRSLPCNLYFVSRAQSPRATAVHSTMAQPPRSS